MLEAILKISEWLTRHISIAKLMLLIFSLTSLIRLNSWPTSELDPITRGREPWVALAWLVSGLFLAIVLIFSAAGWVSRKIGRYQAKRRIEKVLNAPDEEIAPVLARFVKENTSSLLMWPWERGVQKLLNEGVLVCMLDSSPNDQQIRFYSLSAEASHYVAEHKPELLKALPQNPA